MNTFNNERTFGVEIEFVGDRGLVADYMNAHGVRAQVEGYGHTDRTYWKLVTDSSCGSELVSPPLKGDEAFRQLRIACDALEATGARVNRNCGLHVHHDANDLSVKHIANIFALYVRLEETIDTFMPASRRGNVNSYCKTLADDAITKQLVLDKLKKAKTIHDIRNIHRTRYIKLNPESYLRHGTIEFRQHSGTMDFEKIVNWVMFSQRMVERAKEGHIQYTYKESNFKLLTLQKMLGIIASSGADERLQEVNEFYVKRARQLRTA